MPRIPPSMGRQEGWRTCRARWTCCPRSASSPRSSSGRLWEPGTSAPASSASWSSPDARGSPCSRRAFLPASCSSCRSWVRATPSRRPGRSCSRGTSAHPAQASSSVRRPGSGSWPRSLWCSRSGSPPRSDRVERRSGSSSAGRSSPRRCCSRSRRSGLSVKGSLGAATDRVAPAALFEGNPKVSISIAAAVLVIAMWTVIPLAIGAWRTCTRDA